MTKNLIPKVISKLYWNEKKSLPEIGKIHRINSGTLHRWMKNHGMSTRSRREAGVLRRKVNLKPKELYKLYWDDEKSTKEIGKIFGVSGSAIRYWMKKYQIPMRNYSEAFSLKTRIKLSNTGIGTSLYETLYHLYVTKRMSSIKMGKLFNVSSSTIRKWLKKYKISIRNRSEACIKHPRFPFSGNDFEKEYLIGFCAGDVYVYKEYHTIVVQTTTTHPAMIKLFSNLFSKYGHFGKYPGRNKIGYQWHLYSKLDESFEFLLDKKLKVPKDKLFYSFLAGYSDAEGCWMIGKSHENKISRIFEIQSQDFEILKQIKSRLIENDFNPTFGLKNEANGVSLNKNLYYVRLCKRDEILSLAEKLIHYSQHEEKLEKLRLILKTKSQNNWEDIKYKVENLRNEIKMTT